ncbi:MAG: hypothetical protein WCF18_20485 [Chthoniobacteraceae bacterium]
MPNSLLRPGQCLLLAAMFCALGGHWLVLQTVAWGGMIVDYSRSAGITVAMGQTFDGKHPCELCRTIAKTRQTEKKQEAVVVIKKLDVFHQPTATWLAPVAAVWEQDVVNAAPVLRAHAPPVPPPRNV